MARKMVWVAKHYSKIKGEPFVQMLLDNGACTIENGGPLMEKIQEGVCLQLYSLENNNGCVLVSRKLLTPELANLLEVANGFGRCTSRLQLTQLCQNDIKIVEYYLNRIPSLFSDQQIENIQIIKNSVSHAWELKQRLDVTVQINTQSESLVDVTPFCIRDSIELLKRRPFGSTKIAYRSLLKYLAGLKQPVFVQQLNVAFFLDLSSPKSKKVEAIKTLLSLGLVKMLKSGELIYDSNQLKEVWVNLPYEKSFESKKKDIEKRIIRYNLAYLRKIFKENVSKKQPEIPLTSLSFGPRDLMEVWTKYAVKMSSSPFFEMSPSLDTVVVLLKKCLEGDVLEAQTFCNTLLGEMQSYEQSMIGHMEELYANFESL